MRWYPGVHVLHTVAWLQYSFFSEFRFVHLSRKVAEFQCISYAEVRSFSFILQWWVSGLRRRVTHAVWVFVGVSQE